MILIKRNTTGQRYGTPVVGHTRHTSTHIFRELFKGSPAGDGEHKAHKDVFGACHAPTRSVRPGAKGGKGAKANLNLAGRLIQRIFYANVS